MRAGVLLFFGICACAASAHARTRTYAVVVAQNQSHDPGVRPLQYADDDGVKTWELLSLLTDNASLFVVPDQETARLHPAAAQRAEVPERAAILSRLRHYNRLMARDIERGDEPELFFIYAGHGDVDQTGQGYINLHDGKFTRAELYREVIAPSSARYLHVIIDACKSYFMVNSRGGRPWVEDAVDDGGRSDRRLRAFLEAEKLARYPRAGVVLATSGDQETHEWSRYRGGILSHELRSALSGAADVNGDGRVEYSELAAFLAAANARVTLPQARIAVFSQAPAINRRRALVDLGRVQRRGGTRFLRFGPTLSGRFHIEDDRGVRYADLNKEAGSAFDVVVSSQRAYFVRRNEMEETEVRPSTAGRVDLSLAPWTARAVAARGAVERTFHQDLYQVPYGPRFYEGYVAKSGDLPVEAASPVGTVTAAKAERPRQALFVGYTLTGAPAGDAGLSHGADLRYAYRLRSWLDLLAAAELGYGRGSQASPTTRQDLTRTALLLGAGLSYPLHDRFSLRFEALVGWQLLRGNVEIGTSRLTGTEPRGLRLEAAGGFAVDLWRSLGLAARGGLAVDGVYSSEASASTRPSAFFNVGWFFRF